MTTVVEVLQKFIIWKSITVSSCLG